MKVLSSLKARIDSVERQTILEALEANHGHLCESARMLGLHRYQLRRLIDRHGLQSHIKLHPWAQYHPSVLQGSL